MVNLGLTVPARTLSWVARFGFQKGRASVGTVTRFVKECTRKASLDWVVLAAGVLLLGIMVAHDVYVGAKNSLTLDGDYVSDEPAVSMDSSRKRTPS